MIWVLIFLLISRKFIYSEIIGKPKVACSPEGIMVSLQLDSPFTGAIYMKGSDDVKSCKSDYSKFPSMNVSYWFSYEKCPAIRQRQLQPPKGLRMVTILTVSYHGSIITHKDSSYEVECFYKEESSLVHTVLNVTAPRPLVLSNEPSLPQCTYKVDTGRIGEESSSVAVGEPVSHIWSCSNEIPTNVYCIQVHSCIADSGENETFEVIDSNGCSIHEDILSNIKYNLTSMRAVATSRAFMFADKHIVYFKCSIRMSIKNPAEPCPINECSFRDKRSLNMPSVFYKRKPSRYEYDIRVESDELIIDSSHISHEHLRKNFSISEWRAYKWNELKKSGYNSFNYFTTLLLIYLIIF